MRFAAPAPFEYQVAHITDRDPVTGTSRAIRSKFVVQQITFPDGRGMISGPLADITPPTSTHNIAAIGVTTNFFDPTIGTPPPYSPMEEIQVGPYYLVPGDDFAVGDGDGSESTGSTVATKLAAAINTLVGFRAVADGSSVYLTTTTPYLPRVAVQATNDYAEIKGSQIFSVSVGSTELTGSGHFRRSFDVPNLNLCDPPTIS